MIEPSKDGEDTVIDVRLPYKDYKIMREIIEERQALHGLKRWIQSRVLWLVGGALSVLGLVEAFRRFH